MRGGLDETLARMARREEALRRRAEPPEPVTPVRPAEPAGREPGAHRREEATAGVRPGGDPLQEIADAVRRVVAGHPGLAVTVRVEWDGQAYPMRVAWTGGEVTVTEEPGPPPPWPASQPPASAWPAGGDAPVRGPAARLAELIRRDPTLLTDRER